jgi:hypothetical protein
MQNPGDLDVYQRDQLSPRDILAAQDSMMFRYRFGDLNGLKWQKFDYQSGGPRRYLRFGHVEGPIIIREIGDIAPEIPTAQSVQNQNRLSSKADLEILS